MAPPVKTPLRVEVIDRDADPRINQDGSDVGLASAIGGDGVEQPIDADLVRRLDLDGER